MRRDEITKGPAYPQMKYEQTKAFYYDICLFNTLLFSFYPYRIKTNIAKQQNILSWKILPTRFVNFSCKSLKIYIRAQQQSNRVS